MVLPFTVEFAHAGPHGLLTAVRIPDSRDPVPEEALRLLPSEEEAHARTLRGYRQGQFVGGRIALRASCAALGVVAGSMLSDDRGAPVLPSGLVGSVSHKAVLAIALVAREDGAKLGVDLEAFAPSRSRIAPRVLTVAEQAALADADDAQRWPGILLRFSIKEAIYKALDPYVRRYVGFHEVEVTPTAEGGAVVTFCLDPRRARDGAGGSPEGPFGVDARHQRISGWFITSARVWRR